jgi:hypothetical protein
MIEGKVLPPMTYRLVKAIMDYVDTRPREVFEGLEIAGMPVWLCCLRDIILEDIRDAELSDEIYAQAQKDIFLLFSRIALLYGPVDADKIDGWVRMYSGI